MTKDSPIAKLTYSELMDWCTRYLFDGLIMGGSKEMRARMGIVHNQLISWSEYQDKQ